MNLSAYVKISFFIVVTFAAGLSSAGTKGRQQTSSQSQFIDEHSSDGDLIRAVNDQRPVNYIEGGSLIVSKILPDDKSGLRHQKWMVRLSNGKQVQAVYNLDMCPRVQIKEGDKIAMGGQFIWTRQGALLHWLHHDPRGKRPDGFVYANGKFYCKE